MKRFEDLGYLLITIFFVLILLFIITEYPFQTGWRFAGEKGFPFTYYKYTDVGPPFEYYYWWAGILDLLFGIIVYKLFDKILMKIFKYEK